MYETGGNEPFLMFVRDGATIYFNGDLDMLTVPDFNAVVHRVLAEDGTDTLTLNMKGILFADSSGLKGIIKAHDAAKESRKRVDILPSKWLRRVMTIGGVLGELHLIDEA